MAINGLGTQPTFDSSEYEVPSSPSSGTAAPAAEQQNSGIPAGPSAQLELSEAGQQKSSEMKLYRAGEGPSNLEASILKLRAQQKAASGKKPGAHPPHDHNRMVHDSEPRVRTRFADLPSQHGGRVPLKNRVGQQPALDPKHNLLERNAQTSPTTVYGNSSSYNPKVQAYVTANTKSHKHYVPANTKSHEQYVPANTKSHEQYVPANTKSLEEYMKADTKIPEALTEQDVDNLLAYRRDQFEAAILKANEGQPGSRDILASKSAGVKKAYQEIPDALTEQDLEYLIKYRREQLDAAVARKNEMAHTRRMQEASKMPDGLSDDEVKGLLQNRQDQYEAAYIKANEDKLNVEDALASRSAGVRQAYSDLSDALTKDDISYLLQYSQKQPPLGGGREFRNDDRHIWLRCQSRRRQSE